MSFITAVFYDIENIVGGFRSNYIKTYNFQPIYDSVVLAPDIGEIVEQRAYCSWRHTKTKELVEELSKFNITYIETSKPKVGKERRAIVKNFADLHIFTDALEFAYTRPEINCYVLVSYDSDFLVLAKKLTEMDKKVIVFNQRDKLPEVFVPTVNKLPEKTAKSVSSTLKTVLNKYKSIDSFDLLVNKTLEKCDEDETFHSALRGNGINISSLYQQIKNISTAKITFKQNGQKKLPCSLAKALENSRFCVVEINNLFYIIERGSVPETASIIYPEMDDTAEE